MASSELAVVEPTPRSMSLLQGPDPAWAVQYAAKVAAEIEKVLKKDEGYYLIQGRKHVAIEGWQTLAAMTQHTISVEWARVWHEVPADEKGVFAWEARAVVRDVYGNEVASGESMADPHEKDGKGNQVMWARGGNYAVRSMAQTRAMSRAAASRMRYIVTLAGFSGTPAEEVQYQEGGGEAKLPDPPPLGRLTAATGRFKALVQWAEIKGINLQAVWDELGVKVQNDLADDDRWLRARHAVGDESAPPLPDEGAGLGAAGAAAEAKTTSPAPAPTTQSVDQEPTESKREPEPPAPPAAAKPPAGTWQERQKGAEERLRALDDTLAPSVFFGSLEITHPSALADDAVWSKVDDTLTEHEANKAAREAAAREPEPPAVAGEVVAEGQDPPPATGDAHGPPDPPEAGGQQTMGAPAPAPAPDPGDVS